MILGMLAVTGRHKLFFVSLVIYIRIIFIVFYLYRESSKRYRCTCFVLCFIFSSVSIIFVVTIKFFKLNWIKTPMSILRFQTNYSFPSIKDFSQVGDTLTNRLLADTCHGRESNLTSKLSKRKCLPIIYAIAAV